MPINQVALGPVGHCCTKSSSLSKSSKEITCTLHPSSNEKAEQPHHTNEYQCPRLVSTTTPLKSIKYIQGQS